MRRITPEQVVDAYAAIGVKPIRHAYEAMVGGEYRCCGLAACALTLAERNDRMTLLHVRSVLGLNPEYQAGFTEGFDGTELNPDYDNSPEYLAGREDGLAAAVAVFKEQLNG